MSNAEHPLNQLALADPDLFEAVVEKLGNSLSEMNTAALTLLVDETLWGLSIESSFGREIALGYVRLMTRGQCDPGPLQHYRSIVRDFGKKGPTVGRIMARHLAAVLCWRESSLLRQYLDTFDIMYQKGVYTLKGPLECASDILDSGDLASASAYFELLSNAFSQNISYNQSLHLTYTLPKAAGSFSTGKRFYQIQELSRVIRVDISLSEAFLEGLSRGLSLLSSANLNRFISISLKRHEQDALMGIRFLSLSSKLACEMCSAMQVAVPLVQVQSRLNRYVRARTGLNISIKPVSAILSHGVNMPAGEKLVFSDGKFIYLPDEMDSFDHQAENVQLYLHLAKLEAGLFEFGTFEFDFEKAMARCEGMRAKRVVAATAEDKETHAGFSELDAFLKMFSSKSLATALFTLYEHGRVGRLLSRHYPGLARRASPVFQAEAKRCCRASRCGDILFHLYVRIALGMTIPGPDMIPAIIQPRLKEIVTLFENELRKDNSVETSARLVFLTYDAVVDLFKQQENEGRFGQQTYRLDSPFGRCIQTDLIRDAHRPYASLATSVSEKLKEKGIRVYQSDIRKKLSQNRGEISLQDIQEILLKPGNEKEAPGEIQGGAPVDLSCGDWFAFDNGFEMMPQQQAEETGSISKYPEWDCRMDDYLDNHVRVTDRRFPGLEGTFYPDTLRRHQGLVKKMRYAFELLKPEGLSILRQWVEGDQFDYRALLDFAIDRKTGKIPSDRLYIKRVKQLRDVAVLLLVDLSRSTANKAAGSAATVLEIEKEAIVLLSEALTVVGDRFAIAGFSGTGRLGVDYMRIKDFSDPLDEDCHRRINAMAPQRSTRMGAAIRHAVSELEKIPAKVRVMMILGDGFPNDVGYKQGYAIADTRKAVHEAYAKHIYIKAITVNIAGDPKLDDLYGRFNHNVISDITELPDRLLWIYSAITKI